MNINKSPLSFNVDQLLDLSKKCKDKVEKESLFQRYIQTHFTEKPQGIRGRSWTKYFGQDVYRWARLFEKSVQGTEKELNEWSDDEGFDIESCRPKPLILAIQQGFEKCIERLSRSHPRESEVSLEGSKLESGNPLFIAVKKGDIKSVDRLLNEDFTINSRDLFGSPLTEAIRTKNFEIATHLLKRSSPNTIASATQLSDYLGQTAYHYAVETKDIRFLNLLMEYDPQAKSNILKMAKFGLSVASAAVVSYSADILSFLLKYYPYLFVLRNEFGSTPLHTAAETNDHIFKTIWEVVEDEILALEGKFGADLLFSLARRGSAELKSLIKLADNKTLTTLGDSGETLLHQCIMAESKDLVEEIIGVAPQLVKIKNLDNYLPIDLALKKQLTYKNAHAVHDDHRKDRTKLKVMNSIIECLEEAMGATDNERAFFNAALQNDINKVQQMLEVNPDLIYSRAGLKNSGKKYFNTALYEVLYKISENPTLLESCWKMIVFLIDQGTNLNQVCENGNTIIFRALDIGSEKLLMFLIKQGADLEYLNFYDQSPLLHAAVVNNPDMTRLLIKSGANPFCIDILERNYFHHAAENSRLENMKAFISEACPQAVQLLVNAADGHGNQPLHIAARDASPDIVNLLLDSGSSPDVVNNYKCSPLFLAVEHGHLESAKIFYKINPQHLKETNNFGRSLLHAAAMKDCGAKTDKVINWLAEELQMDKESLDNEQRTPLHLAARETNIPAMKILIKLGSNKLARDFQDHTPYEVAKADNHAGIYKKRKVNLNQALKLLRTRKTFTTKD